MSHENYIGYQNMLTTVTTGIAALSSICNDLAMSEQAKDLEQVRNRLQNHVFSVGIMGEFKRGKSTVINALLEQNIVPADVLPCSATLNYVRWSPEKRAEIHFADGTVKTVPVEELSRYVTKITQESKEMAETVDHAVVFHPCSLCQNGVQIVDTPGLNDDDRMTAISEKVIPTLDAIIMVLAVDSPFSKSEAEFVRNKVMTSDLGRIIFVVNKIDHIDEDDVERVLGDIRIRIESSVLEKTAAVYGKDSAEYKNTKSKLGEIRLLPISARNALRGKLKKDRRKYEESGYPEFEAMLSKLLTEERGMLELIHPANKIQSVAKDAVRTIDMRLNAMQMNAKDYENVQKESLETIKATREKKKEEIKTLKTKGKALYATMLPEVGGAYKQIQDNLCEYVQQLHIDDSVVESNDSLKNFSELISPQINQQIEDVLSIQTERMMNQIQAQLGKDVNAMESFGQEFSKNMKNIQTNLELGSVRTVPTGDAGIGASVMTALVEGMTLPILESAFSTAIPGIGGMISGWRSHGIQGAFTGLIAGAGAGWLATQLALLMIPAGLPVALIAGAASTFGGKAITDLFFGKKPNSQTIRTTTEDVRSNLKNSVMDTVENMRTEKVLEAWLKATCDETYEKVAEDIDQEWENTLKTVEHTLSQIEADLKKNEEDRARSEKEMQKQGSDIQQIIDSLKPVYEKLNVGLESCEPQPV